ncbi:MAG: outer membrane lipoprotein carrier protein LolA [Bacteroidetes bacterium]|nr:outer membrane lipoprotein carrier protein LolA [Bacteroidota bacterium]
MNKILVSLFSVFIFCSVQAQYAGYSAVKDINSFRQQFATASQKLNSLQSDFTQEKDLSMLSEKIISKGKFWFKKENKVRMEYNHPFSYLMIMNGSNIYIKDGQKENRVSTSSNKLFQQINNIVVDCVRGTAFSNKDFKFNVFENTSNFLIELTPVVKNLQSIFKNINVIIDKKDFTVAGIKMIEPSGDYTNINFINKILNPNLADALFTNQ